MVCISDTHNQTPSLPKGDVLIHAGDLTNQGTYSELLKQVTWLSRQDFEAKIIIAGNHDLTLDAGFYDKHWKSFHNQQRQDAEACQRLLRDEPSIIYLDHEARTVRLSRTDGPKTEFTVFGSPYSPAHGLWAFSYEKNEAGKLCNQIPTDTDILVTHTPAKGHCDKSVNGRVGCAALRYRLGQVQPRLHVCGHIHEGRGAENIIWAEDGTERSCEFWDDPGAGEGNRKQSILSLLPEKPSQWYSTKVARSKARAKGHRYQRSDGGASDESQERAGDVSSDESPASSDHVDEASRTCIVNAALMQNSWPGPKRLNKPIAVDIELPVWADDESEVT